MNWIDYGAIVLAMLLALYANSIADAALRAALVVYLRSISNDRSPYYMAGLGWVRTYELRKIFGPFVYPALRRLYERGMIDRHEESLMGHRILRDNHPSVLYRWKEPDKDPSEYPDAEASP